MQVSECVCDNKTRAQQPQCIAGSDPMHIPFVSQWMWSMPAAAGAAGRGAEQELPLAGRRPQASKSTGKGC